ncbi:MAG TPA: hypothetical protein VK988_05935 [Acidimicrobiales bacterium]|nr:hypothetical protein [Acidimicrobiales bacterium]
MLLDVLHDTFVPRVIGDPKVLKRSLGQRVGFTGEQGHNDVLLANEAEPEAASLKSGQ